jgi:predicted DCC family thiol-disulfide oxidoreductase YuxK
MSSQNPIIFFDGICNLCNSSVDYVIKHDKKQKFRFASLQSIYAQELLKDSVITLDNPQSLVYYHNGIIKQKSNAVLTIGYKLGFPFSLGVVFFIVPRFLRNYIYDVIARNRYKWFGQKDTCRIPSDSEKSLFLD